MANILTTTSPATKQGLRRQAISDLAELILRTSHVDGPALADMVDQLDNGADPFDYTDNGDGVAVYTYLLACTTLLNESAESVMQSAYEQLGW